MLGIDKYLHFSNNLISYDALLKIEGSSGSIKLRTTNTQSMSLAYNYQSHTSNSVTIYLNPTEEDKFIIATCIDRTDIERLMAIWIKINNTYSGFINTFITDSVFTSGATGQADGVKITGYDLKNSNPYVTGEEIWHGQYSSSYTYTITTYHYYI